MSEQEGEEKPEKSRLYEAYREYVEFLSELRVSQPFASILLAMPSIILLADLLYILAHDDSFIKELTYLGISTAIMEIISSASPTVLYLVAAIMIILLLAPVIVIAGISLIAMSEKKYSNGVFKRHYEDSFINCTLRSFIITFVLFFIPLFVSLGTKFTQLGTSQAVLGALILVLATVDCFIIEYHTFEFGKNSHKHELVVLNYPYRIIDDLIIITALVIVNLTGVVAGEVVGIISLVLRLAVSAYFPFYLGINQQVHQIILVAALITANGILVAHFGQQYYLFLLVATALLVLLTQTKMKRERQWEEVSQEQASDELNVLRNRLFKDTAYVRVFRELIILSRKNNSHRTQLQIQILKSKCTELETLNRGGVRKCSSEDVVVFEESIVRFLQNFLRAAELSISVLKFLQHREGRKEILAVNVQRLMRYLVQNKAILKKILGLNEYSNEAKFLLLQAYGEFYMDQEFLKETEKWNMQVLGLDSQKELKEQLFSQKTTVIFINVLEEIGKIVRISKNLPGVLGFIPSNLIGLSINEIIPFSIKPHHDNNLLNFIEHYSGKDSYRTFDLQFYAYNSDFHLQEIRIHYSWVMTNFHSFHMAGVVERIDNDSNVILTDEFGYLEGWTRKIGSEEFNLDELSIAERKNFNIMPLFPTLIKYMDSLGVYARTVFFKNQKSRDVNLIVDGSNKEENLPQFQHRLLTTFRKMLKEEQLVGACFAEIEMTKLNLCNGRAKMIRFVIKNFQHIENFSQLAALIEARTLSASTNRTDRSIAEPTNEAGAEGSEKQEMSIFSEDEKTDKKIDSNFTIYPEGPHIFPIEQLVFGQFSSSRTSFQLNNMYQKQVRRRTEKEENNGTKSPQSNFNPVLQRNSTLFIYVVLISVVFIVLVSLNMAAVTSTGNLMQQRCTGVIKRNKAAMIYLKSIFNPNVSYVGQFVNGNLLQNEPYLYQENLNYTTFLGDRILLNKYYLFNTQVPATLQRLLQNPVSYGNATVSIIPPTNTVYYNEIVYNYLNIVKQFDVKFSDTLGVWADNVSSIRSNFFLRLAFLCICSILYALLLVVVYLRERAHKETLQAFFKFQKEELQRKIVVINNIVKRVESQIAEWHLLKEFNEIVKKEDIANLEFNLVKNLQEIKIKFDCSIETETKLEKKKYYAAVIILVLFLILQIVFLVLHSVLTLNALAYYQQTPYDLDTSAKLIVLPSYLLADLYLSLPTTIKNSYLDAVSGVLSFPVKSVPDLYNLLSTAPCDSCNFMYPVLTTNYKSFFSTFEQRVVQMKASGTTDNDQVTDLFYAADYVAANVLGALSTGDYNYADFSMVVYAIALIVLCTAIYWGSRSIQREIETLELFLHFFSEEMITKNKHMNRLFSNTS